MTSSIEENKALVRLGYALFDKGDIDGMLALHAPHSVWIIPGISPWSGKFKTHQEIREMIGVLSKDVDLVERRNDALIAEGDTVVVTGFVHGIVRATGKSYKSYVTEIFTIAGKKMTSFTEYIDTLAVAEALEP